MKRIGVERRWMERTGVAGRETNGVGRTEAERKGMEWQEWRGWDETG
jgi:hypothetical protein